MTDQNVETAEGASLHAVLIGIDFYFPNLLPGGIHYRNLGGCVRDVSHVEQFLTSKLGVPAERIMKLTATDDGSGVPHEPPERLPTYQNIVSAVTSLGERASAGDQVYVHYSGHGGRTSTLIPNVKGPGGLDESLVPTDIGNCDARYVRDVELAVLLKRLVDKSLSVAIVLDSCHSGGATRGTGGAVARGTSEIDRAERPLGSLVGSIEELEAVWGERQPPASTRGLTVGSGWLPSPEGYVLLAACRASELAQEYPFDGVESNGALTYWMLDSLKDLGPGMTYKLLHDRVVAKVHSQFAQQTPQLEGDGGRVVFGTNRFPPQYAVGVMQADLDHDRVLLNTGQAHGVRKGAAFAIYPSGASDFAKTDERTALVRIDELGATESWGAITARLGSGAIDAGSQAVLLHPGEVKLQRTVRLVRQDDVPAGVQDSALQAADRALRAVQGGWVRLGEDGPADFQVAVGADGAYEVWDPAGIEIPLRPRLASTAASAVDGLLSRLSHLTKYRNILELTNHDPMSPLARKLIVELAGSQIDYDPVDPPDPQPFSDPGNTPVIPAGTWTFVRIRNDSSKELNVAVLDIQPDFGVTQIYPPQSDTDFFPLGAGEDLLLPMKASLPAGLTSGVDTIKVIATVGTASFRWLELPALDKPVALRRGSPARTAANPLDVLLSAFTAEAPRTRNLQPAAVPTGEWVTAQVEVRVARAAPPLAG